MAETLVDTIGNLSLEDVTARQRKERRDLQAKIMQFKKAVPKGDKKRQKEMQAQVTQMETEFEQKCKAELQSIENALRVTGTATSDETSDSTGADAARPTQKTSKAEKRREKKRLESLERQQRIEEQEKTNENLPRATEQRLLEERLKKEGLKIHDIVPDGNCLFSAVSHQLKRHGQNMTAAELREACAKNLRKNRSEYEAFVVDEDFDSYCDRIEKDQSCWGGQIELQALSKEIPCKVVVYQADGPNIVFGADTSDKTVLLSFHRHLIKLGEHYNSVVEIPLSNDSDKDSE